MARRWLRPARPVGPARCRARAKPAARGLPAELLALRPLLARLRVRRGRLRRLQARCRRDEDRLGRGPGGRSICAAPLDLASLAVIAGGILLNVRAAAALGVDRTYYGHEVAGLPPRRITAFPYSLTSHPMILGNVAAFGGTLINPEFRAAVVAAGGPACRPEHRTAGHGAGRPAAPPRRPDRRRPRLLARCSALLAAAAITLAAACRVAAPGPISLLCTR